MSTKLKRKTKELSSLHTYCKKNNQGCNKMHSHLHQFRKLNSISGCATSREVTNMKNVTSKLCVGIRSCVRKINRICSFKLQFFKGILNESETTVQVRKLNKDKYLSQKQRSSFF